jgi:hypothetical protein
VGTKKRADGTPSKTTLAKYGLSLEDWQAILERQGGVCAICRKTSLRLCVDHDHVPGFKAMAPQDRRRYVRGLLCWFCNSHIVGRGVTLAKIQAAAVYLAKPANDWAPDFRPEPALEAIPEGVPLENWLPR